MELVKNESKNRRAKGEGSIYQTSNGKWRGKLPASIETNYKIKYFFGETRASIQKQIKAYKENAQKNPAANADCYLKDSIKYWLLNVKINELKPSSFDRLESTVNIHIIPNIGHYLMSDITPEIIEEKTIGKIQKIQKKDSQANYSYSSIKKIYDALNSFFKFAQVRKYINFNPMLTVTLPRKDKFEQKEIKIFNDNEIVKFITSCESKYGNGEYRYSYGFAFIFSLYTGIRAGELINLKWEDIDIENKEMYIRGNRITVKNRSIHKSEDMDNGIKLKYETISQKSAKTKSSTNRQIPLNKKAIDALSKLQEIYMDNFNEIPPYVISKEDKNPISLSTLIKSYEKILNKSGIEKCGTHSLRHTFASMLFKRGVDVKTVSEILGHSDVAITYNTYIHLIKEQKKQAIDLLDEL